MGDGFRFVQDLEGHHLIKLPVQILHTVQRRGRETTQGFIQCRLATKNTFATLTSFLSDVVSGCLCVCVYVEPSAGLRDQALSAKVTGLLQEAHSTTV